MKYSFFALCFTFFVFSCQKDKEITAVQPAAVVQQKVKKGATFTEKVSIVSFASSGYKFNDTISFTYYKNCWVRYQYSNIQLNDDEMIRLVFCDEGQEKTITDKNITSFDTCVYTTLFIDNVVVKKW